MHNGKNLLTHAGPGRPKGSKNKIPKALKEMVIAALDEAGGVDFLVKQAKRKNNAPFMALVGKVLPLTVAGDPYAPLKVTHIEIVAGHGDSAA